MMAKGPSSLLHGVAGEYFVAGELSRRGYIACLTLRNTRGIDILASNASGSSSVGIQVKAHKGYSKRWLLNGKAESYCADDLFYVFVRLPPQGGLPEHYIVPSKVVASAIKQSHAKWLESHDRHGREHHDNPMRSFSDRALEAICDASSGTCESAKVDHYRDRWDLLGL
jgi:hypothetical protein